MVGTLELVAADLGAFGPFEHELDGFEVVSLATGSVVTLYAEVFEDKLGPSLDDQLEEGLDVKF